MRVLLFTGKGGVGKTTAAAGTAALAAQRGHKTLVVSTDPAGSLGDALGASVAGEPVEVDAGLSAWQVDTRARLEDRWRDIQQYLLGLLDPGGVDPVAAEELTVLPGAEEVLALLALRDAAAEGRWDVLVVDCAPTGETQRLLALPEALSGYVQRFFPMERRLARTLRPVLGRGAAALPPERVFASLDRLHHDLGDVRRLLTASHASVRLVLTPESVVLAEARRTYTSLALHGYRVDGVLANRVFPDGGGDSWRAGWVAAQRERLAEADESFAPLPVLRVPYRAAEPVGADALADLLAQAYASGGGLDPLGSPPGDPMPQVVREGDGYVMRLPLPLADRDDIGLARSGDELVCTVGGQRRLIALPAVLRRCSVEGARLADGALTVRFRPDPERWMPL